jgi:hypothetical protein|tara:strand:- start:155 stop:292 length:138 start_codon:yes stop_codon:yes gene_type:complete
MKKLIVFLFILTLGCLGYFVGTYEKEVPDEWISVIEIEDELKKLD